ncbi:putative ubiquitin C-terminal hydrolase [Aspergillus mulundensis]|uniref:Uncharacterized protein n=1 Tax=Aspergillus mulundensis TaxID=1810919 RepID=A0A3D8RX11_9EURO|nr:hypothetical protein DSM5745_05378 [Aspergillus mulundensis]RDW78526.1 hypothetical protein DSM5745_05378 [Aspergillus mulundensis]
MVPDAAALPSAPTFAPGDAYNRHGIGGMAPGGGHQNGFSPRFPNIKDLQDEAAALGVNESASITDLLAMAQEAITKFRALADSNEIDRAYVQYAVRTKQGTADTIKQQIVENNLKTMAKPTGRFSPIARRPVSQILPAGTYLPTSPRGRQSEVGDSSTRMPSPSQFQSFGSQGQPNRYSAPPDALAQRLAKLKTSSPTSNDTSSGTANWGDNEQGHVENQSPRPSSYVSHGPTHGSTLSSPSRRPLGPRTMGTAQGGPSIPPKIPLNTSLPRAPDPAYSPIYTVPSQPPSNPPRTSTESFRANNPRYSHLANSPRGSQSPNGFDDNPYRSRTPNGVHALKAPGSNTADLPHRSTISAQELLDHLRRYNILLIDVRSREDYDSGHVYAKSIICIEPVALRENVSAEELEERLVVSPEHEQSLFERRNEFDMVVYYDQDTSSSSYLAGPPVGTTAPHLRALYDTLYEFNAYKPLKDGRPPMLLVGGLDAWIDLLGQQSLATSSTAAILASLQTRRPVARPGRPLGRVPTIASANSSLEIRKRRLRKLSQLNPDELTEWLEKSKTEELDASAYLGEDALAEEPEEEQQAAGAPVSPFIRSYEDFLRRFPEPNNIQQSMVNVQPEPPAIPNYASHVPIAPSRPPPAVPRPSYSGVSDGRQIQAPLQRQNSATKHALYTSNSLLNRLKLPRTGLANFGVTCYMNSTIQCLSATVLMSKFFIDDRFRYYVQKNWKGSQGIMPGLYANLIRSLWKNDVQVIMPTSFRNFCGRLNQEWGIDRQQDAKEFFDFVVDCLHEDLNVNWQRTQLRPLTFEEEMQRERMPVAKVSKIEWDRYCHREESFISSLFAGQHASRLRCTTCKRTSTTYEAFYSISVEIPTSGKGDIYQCLRSYCQEEMLSGDEVWKCPYCKCERVATKQIIITRAPQILVVHFKRFSASKTQSARKIHTPIDFPLHGLRMDDFVFSQPKHPSSTDEGPRDPTSATEPPFTYDAYGVLRHLGSSMGSGHYISLVRDASRQCWRKFDDGRATDFLPRDTSFKDRLQNEQAYIVFYERVPAK